MVVRGAVALGICLGCRRHSSRLAGARIEAPAAVDHPGPGSETGRSAAVLTPSTPPEFLSTATDFNGYVTVSTADCAPRRRNGRMAASTEIGLGITPKPDILGEPKVQIP